MGVCIENTATCPTRD